MLHKPAVCPTHKHLPEHVFLMPALIHEVCLSAIVEHVSVIILSCLDEDALFCRELYLSLLLFLKSDAAKVLPRISVTHEHQDLYIFGER